MNSSLTENDIALLESQDAKVLAEWWAALNRFEWPTEIPNEESTEVDVSESRRSTIMGWVQTKIGIKECLRAWNCERMSDEEFEVWWTRRGHVEAI